MLMKRPRHRSPNLEQLELFVKKTKRPIWRNLPPDARRQISELIARMLLEHLQGNRSQNDRKEVIHER